MGQCGTLRGFLKNRGPRGPDKNNSRNKTDLHEKSGYIISFLSYKEKLLMTIDDKGKIRCSLQYYKKLGFLMDRVGHCGTRISIFEYPYYEKDPLKYNIDRMIAFCC